MNFTRYELHRRTTKSGAFARECEFQIKNESGDVIYTGESSGRLLTTSTRFRDTDDKPAFSIQANRKMAPKVWSLFDASGNTLATFDASSVKRGATTIELSTGEVYQYRQADSITKDYLQASLLLDSSTFVLMNQDKVMADSNAGQDPRYAGKPLLGRLAQVPLDIVSSAISVSRKEFYRSESLRVYDSWTPELACLPAAIMLFKDEVIEPIRSP